jgi:hypothetical protein
MYVNSELPATQRSGYCNAVLLHCLVLAIVLQPYHLQYSYIQQSQQDGMGVPCFACITLLCSASCPAAAAGWDFLNSNETNIAQILGASGYKTSVFGKWHNGRTAG